MFQNINFYKADKSCPINNIETYRSDIRHVGESGNNGLK